MQLIKTEISLTSIEIAELTAKQHKNVKRDIESQLGELGDVLKFEHIYKDTRNRNQTMYVLPKREVLILVSGYNVKLRASIIDRLEYLENNLQPKVCQETPYYLKEVDLKDKRVRKAFFKAFDGRCYYSSKKLHIDNFHIDHILPKSRGGQDVLMNLVVCDPAVNISKLNAYDEEFVKKHQAVVKGEPSLKVSVYLTQEKKEVADSVKIALLSKMANFEKMFGTVTARNYFAEMFDVDICKEDFEVTPHKSILNYL